MGIFPIFGMKLKNIASLTTQQDILSNQAFFEIVKTQIQEPSTSAVCENPIQKRNTNLAKKIPGR